MEISNHAEHARCLAQYRAGTDVHEGGRAAPVPIRRRQVVRTLQEATEHETESWMTWLVMAVLIVVVPLLV